MENGLKVFQNEEFGQVRVVDIDGEGWMVGKDVATVLGYSNASKAVIMHVDEEDKKMEIIAHSQNGNMVKTKTALINESGLYSLVLSSKLPNAKKFKRWVTSDVLPTIRKTGGYVNNDDLFINTYLPYMDEQSKMLFRNTLETVRKQNELIAMKDKEIKEKDNQIEYKSNVIIGLTEGITTPEKRQVLNRVVKYGRADYRSRWGELYKQFNMKYHVDIQRRYENYVESGQKPKMTSKVDYIDRVMDMIPQLYEVACKLYENDVKQLVQEMYELA